MHSTNNSSIAFGVDWTSQIMIIATNSPYRTDFSGWLIDLEFRGHSTFFFFFFFSGRGVWLGFLKCGACKLIFVSERGVLWTETFKFGGLRATIWTKDEAVEAKMSFFFLKGVLWTDF